MATEERIPDSGAGPIREYERTEIIAGRGPLIRRISWAAVFAGTVVAIATQILLVVLGTGIGVALTQQALPAPSSTGVSIGTGVWWLVTWIISLFVGGMVAGRIAAMPDRADSGMHGLVTWGLTTLFSALLLTTAAGPLVGGSLSTINESLASGGAPAAQGMPGFGAAPGQAQAGDASFNWDALTYDLAVLMVDRKLANDTDAAMPQARQALTEIRASGGSFNRASADTYLIRRLGLQPQEAQSVTQRWSNLYSSAGGLQSPIQSGMRITHPTALAMMAWWSFFALMASAGAAWLGGSMASPFEIRSRLVTGTSSAGPGSTTTRTPMP